MGYTYIAFRILPIAAFVSLYFYSGIQLAIGGYFLGLCLEALGLFALKSFRMQDGLRCSLGLVLTGISYYTQDMTYFMLDLSLFYLGSALVIFYGLLRKVDFTQSQNTAMNMITQNKMAFSISFVLCLALAVSNVIVYYRCSLQTWVYFRVLAPIVFSTLFPMLIGLIASLKYIFSPSETD